MNSLTTPLAGLFGLGGMELILILAVVVLLFGAKKLPDLAKGVGQSIKEFKKAAKENDAESAAEPVAKTAAKPAEATKTHGSN